MDIQILRAIVQSHEEVMKDMKNGEVLDKSLENERFPLTDRNLLIALTKSFTDLLSYKVSPEAYQRYSVRIQVIEVLRNWIHPPRELECSKMFSNGERLLDFAERILRTHLTNVILFQEDSRIDVLVTLANALITLSVKDKRFLVDLERLLNRIAVLEQTEESRWLLQTALKEREILDLSSKTVEQLYISQSLQLIEEPLINNFVENLQNSDDIAASVDLKTSYDVDKLLKMAVNSPKIFQSASSILKEIFLHSDYSPKVLGYIKFFLKRLNSHCQDLDKLLLDLYPLHLQSCVILLNIEPEQHTKKTRMYVLKQLEKVQQSSPSEALILVSHFPKWLHFFSNHLAKTYGVWRSVINTSTDA